jgi:hypothetical protein
MHVPDSSRLYSAVRGLTCSKHRVL